MAGDLERILDKLDALAGEVSDLKVQVAKLETRLDQAAPKPSLVRDGTMTGLGGAIGAALAAFFSKA